MEKHPSYEELEERLLRLSIENTSLKEENARFKFQSQSFPKQGNINTINSFLDFKAFDEYLIESILNCLPFIAWVKDINGRIIYANHGYANKTGLTLAQILGKTDKDIYPPHLANKWEEDDKEVILTMESAFFESKSNDRWFETIKSPVFDSNGNVVGTTGYEREVTELKESIIALKKERDLLHSLMDNLPFTIYFKDRNCRFTRINNAQAKVIGVQNPGNAIGKSDFDYFARDHAADAHEDEIKIIQTGQPLINKHEKIRLADGSYTWVSATKIAIHDENGFITGLVGMSRDVSEELSEGKKLIEAKEKAEEADKLKTAFLANMSHEIRTPMNGIIGFSNLLKTPGLSNELRSDYLYYIESCCNTLLALIDDIIDVAKIEAGQISIREKDCRINQLMKELFDSFLGSLKKENKDAIELRMKNQFPSHNATILTDPFRLRQIISNLLGNSIKFTEKGYIEFGYTIKYKSESSEQPGQEFIEFYVKDTGIGIPKDKFKLIFEQFGQVTDNEIMNIKGTGLGLAISYNLVKLLGGTIWLESEMGIGTTFYFTLPYKPVETKDQFDELPQNDVKYNWKSKIILIVEDEEFNWIFLRKILEETKAKLLWARDGKQAIEACRLNTNIDLVLMDIKMPYMDGYQATQEIRKFNKEISIVAQTAFAMSEDKEKAMSSGFNDFVTKPIRKDYLFSILSNFLG